MRSKVEQWASRANCSPLLALVALAGVVFAVMFNFREAVFQAVKYTLMCAAIGFLIYMAIHVTGHIIRWRSKHEHLSAEAEAATDTTLDPVSQADAVLDAALQGMQGKATENATDGVN